MVAAHSAASFHWMWLRMPIGTEICAGQFGGNGVSESAGHFQREIIATAPHRLLILMNIHSGGTFWRLGSPARDVFISSTAVSAAAMIVATAADRGQAVADERAKLASAEKLDSVEKLDLALHRAGDL